MPVLPVKRAVLLVLAPVFLLVYLLLALLPRVLDLVLLPLLPLVLVLVLVLALLPNLGARKEYAPFRATEWLGSPTPSVPRHQS